PQRSPFFSPFEARNVRALRTNSSNSGPLTPVNSPLRISCRTVFCAAALSCENISPTKGIDFQPQRPPKHEVELISCRPTQIVARMHSWAADNLPNSTRRYASGIRDIFAGLPLQRRLPSGP